MKFLKQAVATMCITSIVLAGCGSKTTEGSQGEVKVPTNETTQEQKFNKTGLPIVNEPVTLKVLGVYNGKHDPDNIVLLKELEERTGVNIEWDLVLEDAWKDKKGLLFASGNLPDIFLGGDVLAESDLLTYGSQEILIPLEGLIDEYSTYLKTIFNNYPSYKKDITTPDGHIYGVPSIDAGFPITTNNPLFINKEWLDLVNMEVPTTTDELYDVLKAFKENDVNQDGNKDDEIPFTSLESKNYVSDLFGSFGIIDDVKTHISVENNEILFTATDERYKEAISYFHKLYKEGLIDQELFTQDGNIFDGKVKNPEKRIVGLFQSWRSSGWKLKDEEDYVAISPLAGPEGTRLWPERLVGIFNKGDAAITSSCKNPEVAMRWLDQWYESEFAIQTSFKLYDGLHIQKNAEGKYENIAKRTGEEDRKYFPGNGFRIYNMVPESGQLMAERPSHIVEKQELDQLYNNFYPEQMLPKLFFSAEENERIVELQADIITYVNEMYARWIISGNIDQDWDAYKAQVKEMGLDEYVKIYQEAYNRYMSK